MDLIERLNALVQTLKTEIVSVSDATLSEQSADDWSIKDIIGHLCDHSHILHTRLWKMINLEEPQLDSYDQEAVARKRDASSAPVDSLLEEFATQRAATVEMLVDLVHWNWARTGRHPAYGRISIRQQVDKMIAHEEEHLAQIRESLAV
jgi:DinB superfamily